MDSVENSWGQTWILTINLLSATTFRSPRQVVKKSSRIDFDDIQPLRHFVPPTLYFAGQNTPQCCGTRQGRRLECFVLLRRKLQKLRNVLYSSSAHECAIGEVSVRTEGLKTPSYQSVYTGHIPFSPAMSRSITENGVSYIWERIYKNNPH